MDTSAVIPQFTEAAAAGEPPDIQFVFNGIYHMENVWLGYIQPLNGLISDDTLAAVRRDRALHLQGQQYRVGFYIVGFGLEYDKARVREGRPRPGQPADDVGRVPRRLRQDQGHRVIPSPAGVKDGFFGEWYFVNTLTQDLNSPAARSTSSSASSTGATRSTTSTG